MNHKLAP